MPHRRYRASIWSLSRANTLMAEEPRRRSSALLDAIADLIGSVDRLPRDLSARKRKYLSLTGYGDKRPR